MVRKLDNGALDAGGVLAVLLALVLLALPPVRYACVLALQPRPTRLPMPVSGVDPRFLADTWHAPRSGGRRHEGIDIFAPRGTAVSSPVDGLVLGVGRNSLGGQVVRVLGPGRQVHYFAHLSRFGPVHAGLRVQRGQVLGYVGTTGNAAGTPPHLHYGIYNLPGGAIDPFPELAVARGKRAPWGSSTTSSGSR
jgi:murein DD-endopeptidase MepM/ murein hydrolase activator NlpD